MGPRWRGLAGPVGPLALLPLGLTACADGGGAGHSASTGTPASTATGAAPDEGPERARARVRGYLDAMRTKDLAAGRSRFCGPMRDTFDRSATGPNGDFADHFTVTGATITDVRATDGRVLVGTSVTVAVGGTTMPVQILFTVVPDEVDWCIAEETVGGAAAPAPSGVAGSATPSTAVGGATP